MDNSGLTPVLTAESVTKTYGATVALAGVSLRLAGGESVAVMGASGSGKTTLLHCLAGVTRPDNGRITLHTPGGPQQVDALGAGAGPGCGCSTTASSSNRGCCCRS